MTNVTVDASGNPTEVAANIRQTNSLWRGSLQFTNFWNSGHVRTDEESSTVWGYGAVSADGQTLESKTNAVAAKQRNTYTVYGLGTPNVVRDDDDAIPQNGSYGGTNRNILVWTPWREDYDEVLVIRYLGATEAAQRYAWNDVSESNFRPEQGRSYMVGDIIEYTTPCENTYRAKVIYRGREGTVTDTGLVKNSTNYYGLYTVNNGYYSPRQPFSQIVGDYDAPDPTVDGDPSDWTGTPAVPWNSSTWSEKELIWTDKTGEQREDTAACWSTDIKEFRVKANASNVYFLIRLTGGATNQATNAYAVVGVDTRLSTESEEMNWLGDESHTEIGGRYYTNSAAVHYPRRQMAVHWVNNADNRGTEERPNQWQVEMYADDGQEWYASKTWWQAAGSADGAEDACIEWAVPRADLGLDWASRAEGASSLTGRFTVATFVNDGCWNNQGVATVRIESNSCSAVDMMAIAPYGQNDKNADVSSWQEGLDTGKIDFWMDGRFGQSQIIANERPSAPAVTGFSGTTKTDSPTADSGPGSPWLVWQRSTDDDGFVTSYLLELSETENFGGTEGSGDTENHPVAWRLNIEVTPDLADATTLCWKSKTSDLTSKTFWWRVRARDNSGELSAGTIRQYEVTGKADNDGPVASLLYVGTDVDSFMNDSDYRSLVERNGEAYSVLDSEFGAGAGHDFGFAIQWEDVNGVYATNKVRPLDPGESYPSGKSQGKFAWNILADHSDGRAFGRVSPNWDLMMVNTNLGEARFTGGQTYTAPTAGNPSTYRYFRATTNTMYALSEDVSRDSTKTYYESTGSGYAEVAAEDAGTPKASGLYEKKTYYSYKRQTTSAEGTGFYSVTTPSGKTAPDKITVGEDTLYWGWYDRLVLPSSAGDIVTHGWVLEWGKDQAFLDTQTVAPGNDVPIITNFVANVFQLPTYDPQVALYLTLSAEDGCTVGASGDEEPWPTWPNTRVTDDQGSYEGLSSESDLTSGWCADGPNPGRNVTVNQLLYIPVKDDDMIGPQASTARWGATATDDGVLFKPSMLVATSRGVRGSR